MNGVAGLFQFIEFCFRHVSDFLIFRLPPSMGVPRHDPRGRRILVHGQSTCVPCVDWVWILLAGQYSAAARVAACSCSGTLYGSGPGPVLSPTSPVSGLCKSHPQASALVPGIEWGNYRRFENFIYSASPDETALDLLEGNPSPILKRIMEGLWCVILFVQP